MATRNLKKHNIENSFQPASSSTLLDNSLSSKLVEKVIFTDKDHQHNGLNTKTLTLAKASLHTSHPERLPSRELEIRQTHGWLAQHLSSQRPGAMYISGQPGTGKTAVVTHTLKKIQQERPELKFKLLKINCMNIKNSPNLVFEEIATQLKLGSSKDDEKLVNRLTAKRCQMIVMVLDEVDQLLSSSLSSSKTVLNTIFGWPTLDGSRLILIGIANALDLSTKHLPSYLKSSNFDQGAASAAAAKSVTPATATPVKAKKSAAKVSSKSTAAATTALVGFDGAGASSSGGSPCDGYLMHFTPYSKEDIGLILEDRLNGNNVFDASALKFVASKVAATSGDIRKALNACKIALETVEKQDRNRKREGLKPTDDDGFNPGSSPKKQRIGGNSGGPISVLAMSKVLTTAKDEGPIPLQQGIILLTLHKLHSLANRAQSTEDGIQCPMPIDRVYTEHLKLCEKYMFPRIDRSDLPSACSMLQDRSLLTIVEQRGQSCSPASSLSSSSPRGGKFGKRSGCGGGGGGFGGKASAGITGLLFDPRTIELTLRQDPGLSQKLADH